MAQDFSHLPTRFLSVSFLVATTLLSGACTPLQHPETPSLAHSGSGDPGRPGTDKGNCLALLESLAAADPDAQAKLVDSLHAAARNPGSPEDMLAYALALGSPAYSQSDPAAASDLLVLALSQHPGLTGDQRRLATTLQMEYATRATLKEDLRQRQLDVEQAKVSADSLAQDKIQALNAENARLTRERDELQKKLDAIAEIERSLIQRESESAAPPVTEP
jgi:hypothetical protein